MANLIIKSSADNLVLKGSDNSPAITVAATGTTTFAENATLSGTANNLGTVTAGSIAGGSITSATTFPAGHVVQCVFTDFDPANTSTTVTTYISTALFQNIQKHHSSSRCLVTVAGGHMYQGTGFADGCITTICGQSSGSSFTHGTTYATGDDPASAETMGMQQVYNSEELNSTSHSKQYLFASSGNEFESFRVFYRSRGGGTATVHETNHNVTMTVMEIKQ